MTNEALVLLVIIIVLLGVLPAWPYSSSWGYGPSGGLSLLLVLLLLWVIAGGRPLFRSHTTHDMKVTANDVGHDLKAAGRNAADSIRNALQP